ncbi:MAG: retropepsin-like domain-containing protein [Deltaproteobacteria bacterium]|nr:retropepsin-like domain-containing protein [Deltaproteobacteria bacterium]
MKRALVGVGLVAAAVPAGVAYSAMLGLGLHRHAPPWAIASAATLAVFGPALLAGATAARNRTAVFAAVLAAWALALLAGMPVYFPGERREAVATGIALVAFGDGWEAVARRVAEHLPEEPQVADPEVPEATELIEAVPLAPLTLREDEIALPYEGEGRRLSVPVVFEHQGRTLETWMMLDTGATYTTLPTHVLRDLGIPLTDNPTIRLHTANGERESLVALVDQVWLGNLSIAGAAVATCDPCATRDTTGLLGLNVTGGFNFFVDGDRQEVVFTSRFDRDNRLDISPFIDLSATFTRFQGGRVEVVVNLANRSGRTIERADASIACGEETWIVRLSHVEPGELASVRRRLPSHTWCERYQVSLDAASW